jgi:3-methyladenine DNA glycosylase AlkD
MTDAKRPELQAAVALLKRHADRATLEGMARYAIPSDSAIGVPVNKIQLVARQIGRNHDLAGTLWHAGWYEARMLAVFLDEPDKVTSAQMDRWCRDFDSWAICDTACFHLFDRTAHAWSKVTKWSGRRDEFVKRAAFALLACLALHDRTTADEAFADFLPLIESAATDERNFVKKGVNWALRAVGRRNYALNAAAISVAQRLADSPDATSRWIGKDALRDLRKKH